MIKNLPYGVGCLIIKQIQVYPEHEMKSWNETEKLTNTNEPLHQNEKGSLIRKGMCQIKISRVSFILTKASKRDTKIVE